MISLPVGTLPRLKRLRRKWSAVRLIKAIHLAFGFSRKMCRNSMNSTPNMIQSDCIRAVIPSQSTTSAILCQSLYLLSHAIIASSPKNSVNMTFVCHQPLNL